MTKLSSRAIAVLACLACGLLAPASGRAQQCPWLNAATAGGFLGGEVMVNVTPIAPNGDTTCEFTLTQNLTPSTLRVAVHTMTRPAQGYAAFVAQCDGVKIPLRTIGNEAVYCVANGSGKEQIIGRVRDRAFVMMIGSASAGTIGKTGSGPRAEVVNLAQQIAGALF